MSEDASRGARAWWIAAICAGFGQQIFVVLRNPFVVELGGTEASVAVVQAAGGAAGIVAGLVGLWALRRVSARVALGSSLVANALGFALQTLAPSVPVAIVGSALAGLGIQGLAMSAAPFLARASSAETRVRAFATHALLLQGIPGALGALVGGRLHDVAAAKLGAGVAASRASLAAGALAVALGFFPVLAIREATRASRPAPMFRLDRPALAVSLLVPDVLAFLANGLGVPFLQLYLERAVGLSSSAIGAAYAGGLAAGALGHVVAPMLASRLGTWRALVAAQLGVAALFVVLAASRDPALVVVAFGLRFVLASAWVPLYGSLLHGAVPDRDSGPVASYRMIAESIVWAGANASFGLVGAKGGFVWVLATSAALHVVSASVGVLVYRRIGEADRATAN